MWFKNIFILWIFAAKNCYGGNTYDQNIKSLVECYQHYKFYHHVAVNYMEAFVSFQQKEKQIQQVIFKWHFWKHIVVKSESTLSRLPSIVYGQCSGPSITTYRVYWWLANIHTFEIHQNDFTMSSLENSVIWLKKKKKLLIALYAFYMRKQLRYLTKSR